MKHINRVVALALSAVMLAVPVMAGPSAEQNGKPSIEQNGNPSVSQKGNPSASQDGVKGSDDIIVTDVMDKKADAKIKADLDAAQKLLADTKDLTTIAPKLADVMKDMKIETAVEDLAVRDLFHLALTGDAEADFKADKKITLTFDVELEDGQNLIVMVQNGDQWDVVPAADVKVEDGKATVTLTQLGIIAFVVA